MERRARWDELNNLIVQAEMIVKQDTRAKVIGRLPFTSIKKEVVSMIAHAFPISRYTQDVKYIPEEKLYIVSLYYI